MPTRRDLFKQAGAAAALAALHPVAARAQARKPTLTIGFPSTPETIDPHQFRSVLSGSIINLMGEGLLTRDPQTMEIKPLLAESVKNLNPNTWEVKLRRGVKFHNGEDFNADSVKFTIERAIGSKLNTLAKLTWPPSFGQEVVIVDPYTVQHRHQGAGPDGAEPPRRRVHEHRARARAWPSTRRSSSPTASSAPAPSSSSSTWWATGWWSRPIPAYWGPKPASPRIVIQVIPDAATRLAALAARRRGRDAEPAHPARAHRGGGPEPARVLRAVLAHPRHPAQRPRVGAAQGSAGAPGAQHGGGPRGDPEGPLLRARPVPQHGHREERGQHRRPRRRIRTIRRGPRPCSRRRASPRASR